MTLVDGLTRRARRKEVSRLTHNVISWGSRGDWKRRSRSVIWVRGHEDARSTMCSMGPAGEPPGTAEKNRQDAVVDWLREGLRGQEGI